MNTKIWLSSPHIGEMEFEYVKEAFDTNWIAPVGPHVGAFEKSLEAYLGEDVHVAVLSSGTAAIHLGLILLGIKAGDEVICQSFTFSGTVNPVSYLGATPVFIDSERDSWNMCPVSLEKAIKERLELGKKPGAIIPVHLYGMPANMDAIREVAARYDIPVLEDAAEALGATYNGKKCGTLGDISILSFNGNKIITTSGGGALVSKNKEWVEKARFLSTQARDPFPHYEHTHIGYNYRLSNVSAGIGLGQMKVLDTRVQQRRSNYNYYYDQLNELNGVSFLAEPAGCFSNRWLSTILIDPAQSNGITRETVRLTLEALNIESRPLWKPMHLQPVFAGAPTYTNGVSEQLFDIGLCLPSGSNLTQEALDATISTIKGLWKK
ncbi:aminotransferase class I/II-fold pyridoxal phosphate-dependent enzyme [Chitinophaga pendula]|uniref:DegT/DnrJ/EryC1/StrS family aminotransferase n=1 Tax=Chitinophaga TaxID=79328 RepID=UPI000BAED0F5|nr:MULTISPECIES: aminotransferase class I/II-fold pyridoxal phosphate-dependent enzyme [Chitinophaga]ASZ12398.1 pyridoxal phosphate-dependent aminotransferase [Chitinophaga sp. MD30]UCJ10004.1 aminotransferase class I/II-fold pyridoxal phosphate-dependent enzyme [Chitinophaga pendula]